MSRRFVFIASILALLAVLAPLTPGGDAGAALWISEVLADPASDWDGNGSVSATDDEWVEIHNDGAAAVDLEPYYLRDALGDGAQIRLWGEIGPGEYLLILGSDALARQAETGLGSGGLSLNNTGDTVELYLGDPLYAGAQLLDALIYGDHTAEDDRSLARMSPSLDDWALCDALNPYTGSLEPQGSGCEPSPGEANACATALPEADASWGSVKQGFR